VNEYGEDLAYVHDAGFSDLAQTAANRVVANLRRRRSVEGLVVDIGCGTGVAARRLIRAGYDVLGIDTSRDMLALARRAAPAATFRHGSFVDFELPADCVAVTAIGEVLNYDATAEAEDHIAGFFSRAHAALRPGGLLVLDAAGPGRVPGGGPVRTWSEGADWAILVETSEDRRARVLTRRMTTFRRAPAGGGGWRRTEAEHRQRLHPATDILRLLRDAGFQARIQRSYDGGEPFAPGHRVVIASR
jgi:SAM-dependent methyltransferase